MNRRAARLRLDLRERHRHARADAVSRRERRAGVRRRDDPMVVGPRREARSWQRCSGHADAAGDRQPVRRYGRAAGHAASGPRRGQRIDGCHAADLDDRIADGRQHAGGRHAGHDQRQRERWRRRGRRCRNLGRRRHELAPGGRAQNWSYVWTPPSSGTFTIRTRAVDDSGNLQAPGAGITVTAGSVPDTTAPTVSAVSPANNATGVARTVAPVTFSEAIDPSTINSTTFELRNASTNALVLAAVVYNAATRRATLNPSGNLAARTRFTATVRGGATDRRQGPGRQSARGQLYVVVHDAMRRHS